MHLEKYFRSWKRNKGLPRTIMEDIRLLMFRRDYCWADGRRVTANDDDRQKLYGTALPDAVHHLQLRVDDALDQLVRFARQHCALCVFFQHFNARFVHEKSVVQDLELVVEGAQRVALPRRRKQIL